MDKKELLKRIEKLREELHKLVENKDGNVDDEVVKKSEELDNVLNKYQSLFEEED